MVSGGTYSKPNIRPLLHPRRARARKLMAFTPEQPERWRVSFRCFASLRVTHTHGARPAKARATPRVRVCHSHQREQRWCYENFAPVRVRSAWPLAERYEALLRVFNDPAPYARRLARRLYATPHRAACVLRAPPDAAALVSAEHFAALKADADSARRRFNSS